MKRPKQVQKQEESRNDVINGFSFSFCRLLLIKLKLLREQKRLFVDYRGDKTLCTDLTPIAFTVVSRLNEQLDNCLEIGSYASEEEVDVLIETAEEFLEAVVVKD